MWNPKEPNQNHPNENVRETALKQDLNGEQTIDDIESNDTE